MQIATNRLMLRRLAIVDAPELFRTVGDSNVMQYWVGGPDPYPFSTEQRIAEMDDHWMKYGFGDWGVVEKQTGRMIGFCGLHHIADMAEVNLGYALERPKWRQGFGFEACQAVVDFGFQRLGLRIIVAVIWPENIASIKLAEKLGFRFWKEFVWQGSQRVAFRIFRDQGTESPSVVGTDGIAVEPSCR